MTKQLVQRLRGWSGNSFGPYLSPVPDLLEAADELEALQEFREWAAPQCQDYAANRLEIDRLRAALQQLVDGISVPVYTHHRNKYVEVQISPEDIQQARDALKGSSVEPSEPSFVGLKLVTVVDGSVPADTIEFRASDGRVLGQIRQLATTAVKAKATGIHFEAGGVVPDGCLCWTSEGVLFSPAPDCPIHAERTSAP